ncbi:MAG: hypothetical protein ACLFUP_07330 [Desulfobacteraceae bacterium]
MSRRHRFQVEDLAGMLVYAVGHRPDEFGLVPDRQGYIPLKRLLQAIREEPGWSHVREGHIREVMLGPGRELLELAGNTIRAHDRRYTLDLDKPLKEPQETLLFTPIRKRAHPHVLEKGLGLRSEYFHPLTPDRDMAVRIGRRLEKDPVILEIRATGRGRNALVLFSLGRLYLTPEVPAGAIMGPPISKEDEARRSDQERKKDKPSQKPGLDTGTFVLDPNRDPALHRQGKKGRKPRTWKDKARKHRRRS